MSETPNTFTRFLSKPLMLALLGVIFMMPALQSQDKVVIDQVIAVVGNSAILQSDIFNQQRELEGQGIDLGPNPFCSMLDEVLYQKLLYNQAIIDSVEVSDDEVEQVLERRLRFFIQQIGSRERLEAYYGKSIEELKDEFRDLVREQEISQRMESRITENVQVTPSEVRRFFRNLHPDSIPMIESELVMAQIVAIPPVSDEEISDVKERLENYRSRILQGESFSTLAILYSEDPGSARRGGELGFYGRGELFPEFEAVAFQLRPGEVSEIVETQAGYHILQQIERRGEQVNVRHILIQPKVSPTDLIAARQKLDSLRTRIIAGEMSFAEAAAKYSDDASRMSDGLMVNPFTGTTRFRNEDIDPNLFAVVDRLDVGDVSQPVGMMTEEGRQAFRIVKIISRIDAHLANLDEDYDFIQQLALEKKKRSVIDQWIERRMASTFIFIHEDFQNCPFRLRWVK